MNNHIKILLLLLPVFGRAQNSVVTVSSAMFNKATEQAFLSDMSGWLFKRGNNAAWAKKDINTEGWEKLRPTEISPDYADKNGKVEGWFRIKIKVENPFGSRTFGIKNASWAASDIYIDGALVASFGNTGNNGRPYAESNPFRAIAVPVNLTTGRDYTIAFHLVDYVAPSLTRRLKSEDTGLPSLLLITGPKNDLINFGSLRTGTAFNMIFISVNTLLSLLFWFLSVQNPDEKNLRLIAIGSTFFALNTFFFSLNWGYILLSYTSLMVCNMAANLLFSLSCIFMPVIIARIFGRELSAGVKVIMLIVFLTGAFASFVLYDTAATIIYSVGELLMFGLSIYYVVSSWKKLNGAQWAIVAGLLLSSVFAVIYLTFSNLYNSDASVFHYLLQSGFPLCFPLSLMVYVAMRFKEIIVEVQQNAQMVVKLSEERKEEAVNRQTILQQEVNRQTTEIRAKQAQLIQSEKMASLGELTAGIAHEIQNPLNFVNNFSEVSAELADEMSEELDKGDLAEAKAISADIKQNLEKIRHHGKRADSIVKGMLEHSRASSGQKERTDMNVLADEYLRLAYHGLRAKDKEFNAELVTVFDPDLPKVNAIAQDIGRVLLNLFNNAFYAVSEKAKTAGGGYKPEVSVSTSSTNGQAVVKVKDNGTGIPDAIKEKIMQPFFTTKPTGEGTGLGLSLTYDMVVKGHGGSITVESNEGQGTEFTVTLPLR
jgi:two-component system, NtrC family, sensor kinase